ncbi:2-iminoacetate synthase ThiH [Fusobacterium sp.]|uniref:2-iminoacetate synthase ThiH n=1 Tax=Fusobacterium sp. TaxID=68766 RepID=UPI0025B8A229|nr:2-iminoacetate synthase ThiH [Fusobacterium sp.]
MSYYDELVKWKEFDFNRYFESVTDEDILNSIEKERLSVYDYLNLLSPKAQKHIEKMAVRASKLTRQFFGNVVSLYLPIYVSNYCTSNCIYCGFSKKNHILRRHMKFDEIEREAEEIAKSRIENILLLTGEAKGLVDKEYLKGAIDRLKKYFSSVSIEVMPLDEEDYRYLVEDGLDGLTVYQETYDEKRYAEVHLSGEKKNFRYRLDTPERGAKAGVRSIGIGALLGLGDIRSDAFKTGLHLKYLVENYPNSEFSISFPRVNEAEGNLKDSYAVDDITFVQIILANRIFQPNVGINLSTRESAYMRDNLLPLGITKFSAGSRTEVGGYSHENESTAQFDITDSRSVEEIVEAIRKHGLEPKYKDWETLV